MKIANRLMLFFTLSVIFVLFSVVTPVAFAATTGHQSSTTAMSTLINVDGSSFDARQETYWVVENFGGSGLKTFSTFSVSNSEYANATPPGKNLENPVVEIPCLKNLLDYLMIQ